MVEIGVQSGHQINVTKAAYAPDGRSLATTGADEPVRLWDIGLGCGAGLLRGHRRPVYQLMSSGDGSLLARGGFAYDVRDVERRSCAQVLTGITRHPIDALAIARNGSRVAATGIGGQDTVRQLRVWDVANEQTAASPGLPGDVRGRSTVLALTADGTLAYADTQGNVNALDANIGTVPVLISGVDGAGGLAFAEGPDEAIVPNMQRCATMALTAALDGLSGLGLPGAVFSALLAGVAKVDAALDEMRPGSPTLDWLARAQDPGIPYREVLGRTDVPDGPAPAGRAARLLARLSTRRMISDIADLAFVGKPNDLAVSVSSGCRFPEGRTPLPQVPEISGDHRSYFSTVAGLAGVADGLSPRTWP